jgi:hypothetical protein
MPRSNPVRNSATMANNRTPDNRTRSTQLLNFSNSNAVAWVWTPASPCFQAIDRDQNAWTALRRSLSKQLPVSSRSGSGATQSCRGAKQLLLLPTKNTVLSCDGQLRRTAFNNCAPNRSQVRVSARAGCNKAETVENLWNGRQPDLTGKALHWEQARPSASPL